MLLDVKTSSLPTPAPKRRGFALVTALLLMVLITVVAVGLVGLSAIELRSAGGRSSLAAARANARMALILALGELQKHAGPDQRVTGPAELARAAGGNPATPPSNSQWTAVWKSTLPDGQPVIRRNGDAGGLADQRVASGWSAANDMLALLVSGNEDGIKHPADAEIDPDMAATLVSGKNSAGPAAVPDRGVSAPKIAVSGGQYAWWVGDLNTKANIATLDAHETGNAPMARIRRLQIAQDASLAAVTGASDAANGERGKFVTIPQVTLAESGRSADRDELSRHFTTESQTVLADVRDGGLKKDLTAYLLSDGTIPDLDQDGPHALGVADSDNLVGPPNDRAIPYLADGAEARRLEDVSPSFGLLRHWSRRSLTTPFADVSAAPDYPATRPRDENKMSSYGDHNRMPVEFKNREKSDLSPVLVEASVYYNLSHYATADIDPRRRIGLRLHLYPRVAVWNPYNITMNLGPSMVAMQINGAKQIEVTLRNRRTQLFRMSWGRLLNERGNGFERWRRGTHYFKLDGVTLAPGETVVFSPSRNQPYDDLDLSANLLTSGKTPDPSRSIYLDKRTDGDALFRVQQSFPPNPGAADNRLTDIPTEWREVVSTQPSGNIQQAEYTQADDYFMYWKPLSSGANSVNLSDFMRLPHGRYVSCAFQYGDEDELPVQWSSRDPVPLPQSGIDGVTLQIPDRRTRDGFRLRWFDEHPSNQLGSGSLSNTPHLQCAPIANWNMRSSYAFRSAIENVTDVAPHFFGIYTRDLFDDAVSWNQLTPSAGKSGKQAGDPFDQPLAGAHRILFDVPREGAGIVSLGAFQHLKFSEFIWHPTYAFGNSLADPRIDTTMTQPDRSKDINTRDGGWNRDSIGYATDGRSNNPATFSSDSWAHHARGLLEQIVYDQNVYYDLSYELNHSLWDRFFLSTGTAADKRAFASEPETRPLPNGRLRPAGGRELATNDLTDFHRAASALVLDGGFNVNSTSAKAWEAVLLSSMDVHSASGKTAFPRILNPPGQAWDGADAGGADAWTGQRLLDRTEVTRLAGEIAREVSVRGPFLSLSDFVNRRLRDDDTGRAGTIEAAISRSGINSSFTGLWPLDNTKSLPDYKHADNIKDATRIEQTLKPASSAWGALGYLTQADVLQQLGPVLAARSDSFVIRAYGSARDSAGRVVAEAWCEAVVQRTPEPVFPDKTGLNPDLGRNPDFGRKFEVRRFRWLDRREI